MKKNISVRFYEELNDFLPRQRRKREFTIPVDGFLSVKHFIESFGVPHNEVDLVLANGRPVTFSYVLQDGDRLSVYPMFETFDVSTVSMLREKPLRTPKFILDGHLGTLAKYLRMLGFDTVYKSAYQDEEIINRSLAENRTILTRDRQLLKSRRVIRGYQVVNTNSAGQIREILGHFALYSLIKPLSRCLECNGRVQIKDKAYLKRAVPRNVYSRFNTFYVCSGCGKIYWKGTHCRSMHKFVYDLIRETGSDGPCINL